MCLVAGWHRPSSALYTVCIEGYPPVDAMAIYLKDPDVDRLAREVARLEGKSITDAIAAALAERHSRLLAAQEETLRQAHEQRAIIRALPVLDPRHPDEILYDEHGQLR